MLLSLFRVIYVHNEGDKTPHKEEKTMKKNNVRDYADKVGHKIIGKLERHPELEFRNDSATLGKTRVVDRAYMDEAGNEYYIGKNGVCIVTTDGGVI